MSERFMFMPSLGFCFIIALYLYNFAQKLSRGKDNLNVQTPIALAGVVLAVFTIITVTRNTVWYNDFKLFQTDIAVSKRSAKLNNAAGGSLIDHANDTLVAMKKVNNEIKDPAERSKRNLEANNIYYGMLRKALNFLDTALVVHPGYSGAWLLYGNAHYYLAQDALDKKNKEQAMVQYYIALAAYEQVAVFRPDHEDIKQNRGVVYRDMGKLWGEGFGNVGMAINSLEKSLTFNVDDKETFRLLGTGYGFAGQTDKAIEYFNKALAVAPDEPGTMQNLAVAYQVKGDYAKAGEILDKAYDLYKKGYEKLADNDPDKIKTLVPFYDLYIKNLNTLGKSARAAEVKEEAKKLNPNIQ
jgi:tetratricopeptide (TPR) repeat protein